MNTSSDQLNSSSQHLLQWRDRLQDAMDGALSVAERVTVDAHLSECSLCRVEYSALQRLDSELSAVLVQTAPTSFDQQVFERIAADEQTTRAQARLREQRDHQARIAQLSRRWREIWRFNLGNVLGIAVMLIALVTTAFASSSPFSEWLRQLSGLSLPTVLLGVTGMAAVALWLVRVADTPDKALR